MPRWKTPRWMVGASALVALAVAGCGAAASQPKLDTASEKPLLSLVKRARTDASARNGSAVRADLGQFVSDVQTLAGSDQLSRSTARKLGLEARATAAQAATQLHPKAASGAPRTTSTPAVTPSSSTAAPMKPTPTPPRHEAAPPGHQHDRGPADSNAADGTGHANWPDARLGQRQGHGHGHGHGDADGDGDSAWAPGEANTATQGPVARTAAARARVSWWNHVTGVGGD